ncbi:MAG TPA: Calx-beta domain-containing protein, partial [Verrucomicrobiota bacterium]|nr:Calx-beta domain-containing protein [Verrucomicrobiota bacterium]
VVHYTMTGSASNGVDYVSPPGTVTIPPGVTSADVAISPLDDLLVEGDETVTLVLATNAAYNIGTPSAATLTLRDNELVTVTVTAPDDEASEPGSDFGQFTITRTGVAGSDLVVPLAINGTATPGADFVPLPNPVIIPAGSSSVDLIVIPFEDLFHEVSNETVIVTLLSSPDYNIGSPGQATVTILDNDQFGTPAVGFASAQFAAPENESPGLTVVLSHTSSIPITVQYQVIGGTASSADYTLPPGTLSFEPGEWGKSIPLPIVNDTLAEADETIRVTLFNPTSAAHDAIQIMTYTILDDDVSSVSVAATSPNASETGPVPGNFRVTRVGGTNLALTVNFQITGTASAPGDCPDLGTSVVIPAGENFVDLPVMPVDDGTVELDEFLKLTLISAPGGKIVAPSTAIITILDANTNGLPTVWVSATNQPYAVEGGDSGTFVFSRTGDTAQSLTVYLNTAGSAVSGGDYTPLPASVVIPVGQNSVNIPVNPVDDPAVEGDETVVASLIVHDTYRVLYPGTATVTIQDNDQSVRIDAADFDASEPGNDVGEFIFTRFGTTNAPLQVFFDITGSAANGVDYAGIPGSVTIPAGSLTTGLIITPLDDALVEGLETVTLTLQASAAYTVGSPTAATVTIRDDEPVVGLVSNMDRLSEGARVPATITVRREGDPAKEFTARLAVGGSATFGVDYPAFETNVVFNCGVVAVDLWISPTNELAFEDEEELTVTLLPDTAYSLMPDIAATVAIEDVGTNLAPVVTITSPTTNVVYVLPSTVNLILAANIEDPNGDWLSPVWSQISGPDALAFGDVNQTNTTVTLTNSGVYVLRLSANDGYVTGYEDLTVVVGALERLTNSSAGEELLRWSFDEGLGATVFDESGNNRHGSIQGATGWITNGIAGGALNLSGANNFVRVENDSSFMEGLTRFTIACWIGPQSVPDTRGLLATDDGGAETTLTLASRAGASCGSATNVIEATMATICDSSRLVSAPNALTNGWQHILLTWSNGLAPQLYINGQFDQPNRHKTPLRGELVNCPQFLLGKGPSDIPATWAGKVDELRVFSWHMSAAEVGAFVAANFAAVIEMPTNIVVPVVTPVQLSGVVTDDNRPVPPGGVTFTWSQVSGPMDVEIPDPAALTNEISFTQSGEYTFRLIADDGQVKVYADLPVTVVEPTQVHAYASDSFAAELGPDTAEFTFTRNGDLSFELTVFFTLGGTASNGVDYVEIPNTGSITFPVEVDFLTIPVTPFLDHRTEGNETIVITVVSNVLYTIVSAEAVVTIQDSPYGMWNIGHFTLEELTDPSLSGETADFDGDGFFNFVEYAANRLPKSIETNALLQTSIELDENTGLRHITLTYQRRIEPTDVAYAAAVSTNLLDWQTGSNAIEEISATADPNGLTETVKARVLSPWPSNVPQFVTVRVWLRSTGP